MHKMQKQSIAHKKNRGVKKSIYMGYAVQNQKAMSSQKGTNEQLLSVTIKLTNKIS